ncbi:MAG: thiamine diphosphokinase [Defluviitaleaceae bacterium]|nr:thiamine diphosphokinase [Defluviitaleaceae bacterium]
MNLAIIANGEIRDYPATRARLADADFLIACDGGTRHFALLGLTPNVLLGDFDSADADLIAAYKAQGIPAHAFPPEKDDTDLALAAAFAQALSPASIVIVGALGGRFDHALANLHVLGNLTTQNGDISVEIWDETTSIMLAHPYSCCEIFLPFPRADYQTLSLYPLGTRVTGITTRGLVYPLENETLRMGETRGTSNEFTADIAEISVESGLLLVVRSKI